MIYIYTEDSKDGFIMCKLIKELYFDNIFDDIKVDTLNGIWFLDEKLAELSADIKEEDMIIIVYDDIKENPLVSKFIREAEKFVDNHNLYEKIMWLPTKSFELEVLLINGIEFFMNRENYSVYFEALRSKFIETGNLYDLTKMTKANSIYDGMYEKARKEKQKRALYRNLGREDFENTLTIETISKDIIKKMFLNEDGISKPMNDCWVQDCCYKHFRCKNDSVDFERIIEKQVNDRLYKTKFLLLNMSYVKLIKIVYHLKGKMIELPHILIEDMLLEKYDEERKND